MRVSVSPVSVVGQQRLDTLRWWRDVHTSRRVRGRPVMWSVVPSSSVEAMSCLHWEAPRVVPGTELSRLSCDQHSFIGGFRGAPVEAER